MEIVEISKDRLKVVLDAGELQDFAIDLDKMDYNGKETEKMLEGILAVVRAKTDFGLEKGKTYAQLYPSRAGGCELFLVHISAKEQEKSRALVPFLEDGGYFCCFEGREEALFFERLLEGYGLGEGSVFYDRHSGNYLFYVGKGHGQPLFLEEFAKPAGHWTYSYLLEHFERIERI
jgi:hypothetical protein